MGFFTSFLLKFWIFIVKIVFIVFILVIGVFLPIRKSYDNYFFQLDEEMKAGDFLAYNIPFNRFNHLALSQISGDYVVKKIMFYHRNNSDFKYPVLHRPHTDEFYQVFNHSSNLSKSEKECKNIHCVQHQGHSRCSI